MQGFTIYGMTSDFGLHWSLILLFLPLIHRLWLDRKTIIVDKEEVNHGEHTIITGGIMIVVAFLVWRFGPAKYLIQPLLLSWGIFVLCFDYILNLIRGKSWFYVDEELDGKESYTDRLWLYLGVWGTLFIKIWVFAVTFSVYFYLSLIL